jgi:uncharacterized surface anchored protein
VLSIVSDSSSGSPTDGVIPTYDKAQFRLNVSQNGADSVGNVVSVITLTNGRFLDGSANDDGINPPKACNMPGSSVSANQKTLTCNLGPMTQGTTIALDYAVQASGDVKNNDLLSQSVTVGGAPVSAPTIRITGVPRVDVSTRLIASTQTPSAGGTPGRFLTYAIDVRTSADGAFGSLPLSSVSFVANWANIQTQFPNARLTTNTNMAFPHQTTPLGLNSSGPFRSQAAPGGSSVAFNSAEWIIPGSGAWAGTFSSSGDTTVDTSVTGFNNETLSASGMSNRVVTSGALTIFVPETDIPVGTTPFTLNITNVVGVPRGGGANVSDFNTTNNSAASSFFKVVEFGYRNQFSAWVNSSYGLGPGAGTLEGQYSTFLYPQFVPQNYGTGGEQRTFTGAQVNAVAYSAVNPSRFTGDIQGTAVCMKFRQTMTASGNAVADVHGSSLTGNPTLTTPAHGAIRIQYATISGISATTQCDDSDATWSDTRPATFNAVRAWGDMRPAVTATTNENRTIVLALRVPFTIGSYTNGTVLGFWNASSNGFYGNTALGINGFTRNTNLNAYDSYWIGTNTAPDGKADIYNVPANTGDSRSGDRIITTNAVAAFDKTVCGETGTPEIAVGAPVQFCLDVDTSGISGGNISGLQVRDESVSQTSSPFNYQAGSSVVTINGVTSNIEPTLNASNHRVWTLPKIPNNSIVKIEFTARAKVGVATPGGSWTNTARVVGGGIVQPTGATDAQNPMVDTQAVSFRVGRYELNITKGTSAPAINYPNSTIPWDLILTNQGETTIAAIDVIDILPWNGDDSVDREPASDFSGTVGLSGPLTAVAGRTYQYTTAAPASISYNPLAASNQTGGSTTWVAAAGITNWGAVTAVRIKDSNALGSGETRTYTVQMTTAGNAAGDIYTNDVGGSIRNGTDGPILPIRSNDVTVVIRAFSLGDRVWYDDDRDGIQDAGENGIPNATVRLLNSTGAVIATTTTDANGNYLFENLRIGSYTVQFVTPAGHVPSPSAVGSDRAVDSNPVGGNAPVTITGTEVNDTNLTIDAGFYQTAAVGDLVWNDLNANGIQDAGEPGIAGVTVNLAGPGGVTATTTTDATGVYGFYDLTPGEYTVTFVMPSGYTLSPTAVGTDREADSNGLTTTVEIGNGEANMSIDLGLWVPGSIGDRVWHDVNANGIQDAGEPNISGVTVTATGPNGYSETRTTDANGAYSFTNLPAGDYTVTFTAPSGYVASPTAVGTDRSVDSNGLTSTVTINGNNNPTIDLGLYRPSSIGDFVWNDVNGNGVQNAGEVGIPNVTVNLVRDGLTVATTTTDANGAYLFDNLAPGAYTVNFVRPSGWTVSPSGVGGDPANDSNGLTSNVTLPENTHNMTIDLGMYQTASVGNLVWEDINANGIQDDGEPGIEGATVWLTRPDGSVVTSMVTDANGNYYFHDLAPGEYVIVFDVPNGCTPPFDPGDNGGQNRIVPGRCRPTGYQVGDDNTIDSDGNGVPVTLTAGEDNPTIDTGFYSTALLGDVVWNDTNANGIQEEGEFGIPNVTVELLDADGNVIDSTQTDGDGWYQFEVDPGTYTVHVTAPDGFVASPIGVGDDPENDSNPNDYEVTLASGDEDLSIDYGFYEPASLGDWVWLDTNSDGIQDGTEDGVEGVVVTLLRDGLVVAITTTGSDGSYEFTGLAPGSYTVDFIIPTGYSASPTNAGTDTAVDSNGANSNVTLAAGEHNGTIDLGIYQTGAIGDTVWNDLNGNGIQDAGEPGVPGVGVSLNGPDGTVNTVTDADGKYLFSDLPPGTYVVTFTEPTGWIAAPYNAGTDDEVDSDGAAVTVVLGNAETNLSIDYGIFQLASLGDRVWNDLNANGIQDAGEPGLAGVTVTLTNSDDEAASVVTDANGNYSFIDLPPGTYTVTFTTPDGYTESPANTGDDDNDSNGLTSTVTLTGGQSDPTIDFGVYQVATVGDFVWNDLNANGVQDAGEPGIEGVTVTISGPDGFTDTTTTDENGAYEFTDLVPGTYTVTFTTPDGYNLSPALVGTDRAVDSNGLTTTVALAGGVTNSTVDLGLYEFASVGDFVWYDTNANGVQDAGENGVEGVTVTITGPAGFTDTTATDADGAYEFTDLVPGSYTVTFTTPAGHVISPTAVGTDRAVDSNGLTTTIVLASGENNPTIDLGVYELASFGDFVWHDLNANGIQDAGEPGIAGVTVRVLGPAGFTADVVTDSNGAYEFTDLVPGTYQVTFLSPSWTPSPTAVGTDRTVDSNGLVTSVVLSAGDNDPTIDLGLYRPATVGNFVWNDLNANGVQDAGEPGIEGVTVTISGPDGFTDTTTTDENGAYEFTDLVPGEYTVTFTTSDGYELSPEGAGTPATDSNGLTTTVTLESGDEDDTIDLGAYLPASVGDFVWHDLNANGVQDAGEPGIEGVTVTVTGPDGFTDTTTTDENGAYEFTGLVPGTYTVTFTTPDGYSLSPLGAGTPATDSNGLTTTVTLESGDEDDTIDLGAFVPAEVGDFVWEDLNANGVQDADEPGIEGVTVNLMSGNLTVATTTTDENGEYLFTGLIPGDYRVVFVAPAGYVASPVNVGTDDAVDSDGTSVDVTLADSESNLTVDLGLYRPASIGDFVWQDTNANGVQDAGEPGIEGVTVTVTGPDGFTATTTTDADGAYSFTGLVPGEYTVTFTKPDTHNLSPEGAGTPATDSDGLTTTVTLESGDEDDTIDLGLWVPGTIGDFVWQDTNANGVQDAGEPGIEGVTVTISGPDGFTATATTDENGEYLFDDLAPGEYTVTFTVPDGYNISPVNVGDPGTDSNGVTSTVELPMGESDLSVDLGLYRPASVGDYVWRDSNANGVQDEGENGIEGVTVTIVGADGFTDTTTTDEDGLYIFTGLIPGDYTVTFTAPDGYALSPALVGTDRAVDSNGENTDLTLVSGDRIRTVDLGLYRPISVGDFVWHDLNANGVQDENEPGIEGVTVTIEGPDNYTATTTTDADGKYIFEGLAPGEYIITFSDTPDGFVLSPTTAGSDTEVDSNGLMTTVNLPTDEDTDLSIDLGLYRPVSLGDCVWEDVNGNGQQDEGEAGVPGVVVILTDADGNEVARTTTGDDCKYLFENLPPGDYTVTFEAPEGMIPTHTNVGDPATDSNGPSDDVTLTDGENNTTIDFGLVRPVSLGDTVWADENGNGQQDNDEPGVQGVTVTLTNANGDQVATTTTDADGKYLFTGLIPGTYTVTFSNLPAGMVITSTETGDDRTIDSNGLTTTVTLTSGQSDLTIDLGLIRPKVGIAIVKYVNGDDANEAPGVELTVGDEVTWTYVVTNVGETDLVDVKVTDDIEGDITCPATDLPAGESFTCELTGVVTKGQYTNVGTVTGTNSLDPDESVTDDDPANYTGVVPPVEPPVTPTTVPPVTPTTNPPTTVPVTPTTPAPPITSKPGIPVPVTGAGIALIGLIGLGSILGGLVLVRRRKNDAGE